MKFLGRICHGWRWILSKIEGENFKMVISWQFFTLPQHFRNINLKIAIICDYKVSQNLFKTHEDVPNLFTTFHDSSKFDYSSSRHVQDFWKLSKLFQPRIIPFSKTNSPYFVQDTGCSVQNSFKRLFMTLSDFIRILQELIKTYQDSFHTCLKHLNTF